MSDDGSHSGRSAHGGWVAVELSVPERLEQAALASVGEGCLGATVEAGRLTAYFHRDAEARRAAGALDALLRRAGIAGKGAPPVVRAVPDRQWAARYQASLRPFRVGRRFVVDPTGAGKDAADALRILLVPGQAFGTGEHATTRLCLAALERHVDAGSSWLDVGCGSGILAVAARRCGAGEVLAVDIDGEAVGVAREVVRRNGVGDAVRVECGDHERGSPKTWSGVVANIEAAFFARHSEELAARLASHGKLVASGFLDGDRDEIRAMFVRAGVAEIESESVDGWGALVFERVGDRG